MTKSSLLLREASALQVISMAFAVMISCSSCSRQTEADPATSRAPQTNSVAGTHANDVSIGTKFSHTLPLGLPEYHVPSSNPMTVEKVELGRKLFFDTLLSVDQTMSCATCHDPEKGWSNGEQFALGTNGLPGKRNVPTIVNAAYYRSLFWDGRSGFL